jgi:GNAT superfamily N-acetyltransferase
MEHVVRESEITKQDIYEVTGITYVDLACNYNHGSDGYMKMYISFCSQARKIFKKEDFTCDIIIKRVDEKIVGWAIVQDLLYRHEDYLDLGIYVLPEYRKQGHGSDILNFIKTNFTETKFSVWINKFKPNSVLFKKFNSHPFYLFDGDYYKETGKYQFFNQPI